MSFFLSLNEEPPFSSTYIVPCCDICAGDDMEKIHCAKPKKILKPRKNYTKK